MIQFLHWANYGFFYYYLLCNVIYLVLVIVAIKATTLHQLKLRSLRLKWYGESPLVPPISVLIPAHNEEKSIGTAVRNALDLNYPSLEVIIVNDGSQDGTLEALQREFHLRRVNAVYVSQLPCSPVRGLYRSDADQRLLVLDKEGGGSKADAVNAGLNAVNSPYVCVVDADSILEHDSLLRIMVPVLADPERVVAVGGIVRVINGSHVAEGRLEQVRLPRKGLEVIQVVEYLRAFLMGREAWAQFNMLVIISGAFGLFRTSLVRAVGGYRAEAIGEDLDLIVRLHRHLLDQRAAYRISFVPDPVCWTEVPSDLRSLARQRARWHQGLLDVLRRNEDMLFRPRYGRIGWLALPYQWVFEFLAPVIELGGIATIILAACLGALDPQFFLEFLMFGYVFATVISIGCVLQEEITYRRYNDWQDVLRLVSYCFLEHFPYRQLHMVWRLQGAWQYLRGDLVWKSPKRQGLASARAR